MMFVFSRFGVLVTAASLLVLASCQGPDKLVHASFHRIQPRVSTETDVVQFIGEPDAKLAGHWVYQRPEKHLHAFVEFDEQGVVTRTQWVDALGEVWEEKGESIKSPNN